MQNNQLQVPDHQPKPQQAIVAGDPCPRLEQSIWQDIWPSLTGPAVAIFAIFAVHVLTRRRDREKTALDLHKAIQDSVLESKLAVIAAWEATTKEKRLAAILDTNWRLQQIGNQAERLSRISARRTFRRRFWILPVARIERISLTRQMAQLRDALTQDPFPDLRRKADKTKAMAVDQAFGEFLAGLDQALFDWLI